MWLYIYIDNRHTRKSLKSKIWNQKGSSVFVLRLRGCSWFQQRQNNATAILQNSIDWANSVGIRCTQSKQKKSLLKRVSNSPLCNSSPKASTVVPREEKLQKGASARSNSSVYVYPGYSWTWTCEQFVSQTEVEWEREEQDKGTSTSSRSSIHQQNGVETKWNTHTTTLQTPSYTSCFFFSPFLKRTHLALCVKCNTQLRQSRQGFELFCACACCVRLW